ncbi:MAG TPA: sigma-70 family RNA polymerase sigma factor [Candidatus Brocadiia bacterium]|nr:sigma-70 family RNA polymerase sigma factor [Candidatus Brocadiia bacterium]
MGLIRSREQDRTRLSEVYDRYGSDIYRYLMVLLSGRNFAEDVMQEVFLRLLGASRKNPEAVGNRLYVMQVARNEAFRALKKSRRPAEDRFELLDVAAPARISKVEKLAIQEAVSALPEEQREVIHLKVFMNMSFAEIADVTGVTVNTAASRYRYAAQKLRESLSEEE